MKLVNDEKGWRTALTYLKERKNALVVFAFGPRWGRKWKTQRPDWNRKKFNWKINGETFYTEHQKKLITSSECHSLKSTASKWFLFEHRLGNFILNKHIQKKEVYFNHRGDKCKIARGQFSKITETACLSGWELRRLRILKGKFSSGIEGALALTLNRDFRTGNNYQKWFFVSFLLMFSMVIWVTLIQKRQK